MPKPELLFPYMFWAHAEAWSAPYALTQSGMPEAHAPWLTDAFRLELVHPTRSHLGDLEARLGELFDVDPARVLVTLGTSTAMSTCAARWFRGARVVSELPSYEPFRALPRLWGAELALVERRAAEAFRLAPERVDQALGRGPGPAHAFLCTPHNPTGAYLGPEELVEVAAACARRGGVLVANETYMEFAPPAERFHAFALAPNAVSLGGLHKAYGLGSLRIGWILLGEGLAAERRALTDLLYLSYVNPPTASLAAALLALDHLPELLKPLRSLQHESAPLLDRWLSDTAGVEGFLGPYGLCAFPRIAGVDDTSALAAYLAAEHGVGVVPGEHFGLPGHLRISYGVPPGTLEAGLERLAHGIEAFRA